MDVIDLLVRVADAFEEFGLPFMLIGGLGVAAWRQPRLTKDVDIAVAVPRRHTERLKQALIRAGARPTAVEMRLLYERTFIRLKTAGPKLDVHRVANRHDRDAFANARPVTIQGRTVRVARPEDLILYKLQAWREHDQSDVRELLHAVRDLDLAYLDSWLDPIARATALPMRARWDDMRKRPPPEER